jgi:chromosome segregation ATPase
MEYNIDAYIKDFYARIEVLVDNAKEKERVSEQILKGNLEKEAFLKARIAEVNTERDILIKTYEEKNDLLDRTKEQVENEYRNLEIALERAKSELKLAEDSRNNQEVLTEKVKEELNEAERITLALEAEKNKLEATRVEYESKVKQLNKQIDEYLAKEGALGAKSASLSRKEQILNDRESEVDMRKEELKRIERSLNGR